MADTPLAQAGGQPADPATSGVAVSGFNANELHPVSAPAPQPQPGQEAPDPHPNIITRMRDGESFTSAFKNVLQDNWNFSKDVVNQDWIFPNLKRAIESGFNPDPSWRIPSEGTPEWKQIFDGIPVEYYNRFADALSKEQALSISGRIKAEMEANQRLASYGLAGTVGRFATDLADPVGLVTAVGTGSASEWALAGRSALTAAKASRITKAVRAGLSASAANMAVTALADSGKETADWHDTAFAAVQGFILGGSLHALFPPKEIQAIQKNLGEQDLQTRADETASIIEHAQESDILPLQPHGEATLDRPLVENPRPSVRVNRVARSEVDAALQSGDKRQLKDVLSRVRQEADQSHTEGRTDPLTGLPNRRAFEEADKSGMFFGAIDLRKFGAVNKVFGEGAGDQALQYVTQKVQQILGDAGTLYRTGGEEFRVLGPDPEQIHARLAEADAVLSRETFTGTFPDGTKARRKGLGFEFGVGDGEKVAARQVQLRKQELNRAGNPEHSDSYVTFHRGKGVRETGTGSSGGPDTLSAARVEPAKSYAPMEDKNIRPSTGEVDIENELGLTAFAKARRSFSSIVRGHKDSWVRNRFGKMFGDAVGQADKSRVNLRGADEAARSIMDIMHTQLSKVLEPAYKEWAKARGYSYWQRLSKAVRQEFGKEVGRYIETPFPRAGDFHPAAVRVGKQMQELFNNLRKLAQDAGVHGFETLPENRNYLPHIWDGARVNQLNKIYKTERLDDLFTKAFQAANPDVEEKVAKLIGRGFHNRIRRLGAKMDGELLSGVRTGDVSYMREVLAEAGADSDTIEYAVKQLEHSIQDRSSGGGPKHGKHRVEFDTHKRFEIWNEKTNQMDTLSLGDMLEGNAENLFLRYLHPMAGTISLAREAGFRSETEFRNAIQELKDRMRDKPAEADRLSKVLQDGYDLLVGRSLDSDPQAWFNQAMRYVRLYNYPRTMGQVAWSSITDLGNLLNTGYFRHMLTHVPELKAMLHRAANGKLESDLANELEDMFGLGTEFLNNSVYSHSDGLGPMSASEMLGNKAEHALRQSGRFTTYASGMAAVQNFIQRLTTHAVVQRFVNTAHGLAGGFGEDKLRFLGLSDKMAARVFKQLKKAGRTEQSVWSKKKLVKLDITKFTDLEARDAFVEAVRKEARRISQQNDIGQTHPFMHTSVGKTLFQFRNFVMVAHEKQMLHAMHMRNAETFTAVMSSILLAGLAVAGQQSIALMGADQEKRDRALSPENLIKQGIARSTHTALLPSLIDSVVSAADGGHPVFGYRSSGLANDYLMGNPTVDLISKLGGDAQAVVAPMLNPDYKFSQQDFNNIWRTLLFQNMWGMTQLHTAIANQLPKQSLPQNYWNEK